MSSLAAFWQDLKGGRLKECVEWLGATRSYTIAKVVDPRSGAGLALRAAEEDVLLRILCGEQQKVVSSELGIAHSTTSKRHLHALTKLGLVGRPMPIAVVLAAQCAAQVVVVRTAKTSTFTHDGSTFVVASVPRPTVHGDTVLTRSEREIFTFLVEGCSRHEIASSRTTSVQTVSCQLRAIFSKLGICGRHAAIRRAAQFDWFH